MKNLPLIFVCIFSYTFLHAQVQQVSGIFPVDPQATKETKALLKNLINLKGTMFGHQDDLDYGIGWKEVPNKSDVNDVAGDYPAVIGWEIGNVEFGNTHELDSVSFDNMRKYIQHTYSSGGVTTISWHANNPLTGGNAWDVSSKGVVKSILPGGSLHAKYKEWLGKVAVFIKSLKSNQGIAIPILFRPFHELTGSWFWWGRDLCSPEEYKSLWRFTVTYLRDIQQVHQLLYIYSTDVVSSESDYLDRYPGDQYSDVLGIDIYHRDNASGTAKFIENVKTGLSVVAKLAKERNKAGAFTETGLEQVPIANWWTTILWKNIEGYNMSYVLVWRNAFNRENHFYAPYPGQVSAADFIKFENLPKVLFRKDLKNMYQ